MKILFIHNRYRDEGGEERVIDNLEYLLTTKGHSVARLERSSREWQHKTLWQKGESFYQTIYSSEAIVQLDRAISLSRPDVIHIHNVFPLFSPSVYLGAYRHRIPIVQTIHNYRFLCVNGLFLTPKGDICERCKSGFFGNAVRFGCYGNSRLKTIPMAASLAFHRFTQTFQRCIAVYLTPTEFVRSKLLEAGFPQEQIKILAHPVIPIPIQETRSKTPLFVYVGRLSREKGVWTLLKAFNEFREGNLKIIGDGALRSPLEDYVRTQHLSHVEFLGKQTREEIFRWLARSWALVAPSECYETFGQSIVEAWSCGTPTIVSQGGSLAELVQNHGTGWTFPMGNIRQLVETLRIVAHKMDKEEQLSKQCLIASQTLSGKDRIYSGLLQAYQSAGDLVALK